MDDLVVALGLVLAIEGICCFAFPMAVKRAMEDVAAAPIERLRIAGVVAAACGVFVVWAVRGLPF